MELESSDEDIDSQIVDDEPSSELSEQQIDHKSPNIWTNIKLEILYTQQFIAFIEKCKVEGTPLPAYLEKQLEKNQIGT